MASVELDRTAFDGHLGRIRDSSQSFRLLNRSAVHGAASTFDVATEMIATFNRIEAVVGLYRDMVERDAAVSASACDQLEQVDVSVASSFAGQG